MFSSTEPYHSLTLYQDESSSWGASSMGRPQSVAE